MGQSQHHADGMMATVADVHRGAWTRYSARRA
jgi:hypothetical protein